MVIFAIFLLLRSLTVYGLKLTLKQDMSKVQEQLSPNEIGQFLHSIKNLPSLAEFLDPSRSRLNFDFYHYYNNYGCADTRVFNWKRISKILTYGGLSRADKLVLLNGRCLSRWPGFFTIPLSDLKYLLSVLPELNPILALNDTQDFSFVVGDRTRWNVLIEHASVNRDLNFIPGIDFLFKNHLIKPNHFESSPYFNLIGPNAIDSCFQNPRGDASKCFELVYFVEHYYKNLTPREIFYWALNIGIVMKYDMRARNILFLKGHFDKLVRSRPWDEFVVNNFIKAFSTKLIYKSLRSEFIPNDSILEIFRTMLVAQGTINEEYDFYLVEFYKWVDLSAEYFGIDQAYLDIHILKGIIFKTISNRKNIKYADYFLNFFIEKRQFSTLKYFKQFLKENYDPSRPSHELIKGFRRLSWLSGADGGFKMTQAVKSFLDYDIRASLVRKLSFDHPEETKYPATIDIYFGDNEFINTSMFNCIYDSLMHHRILVYPLEVDIATSGYLKDLIKESIELETVLQKFWGLLADYSNGFMIAVDDEDPYDNDDDGYLAEFIPSPWTHPLVFSTAGRVMTLAFLHGIKLNGWRLKKSVFKSVFKINSTSIYKAEDGRIKEHEEGHFLEFFSLNDYMKEIEALDDTRISDALIDLMKVNQPLKPQTRKALYNYRNNLLKKNHHGFYTLKSDYDQVWSSKIFKFLEESNCEDVNIENSEELVTFLTPHLPEMNLDFELIEDHLNLITKKPIVKKANLISERDTARTQIYSLYLGLQPLTRFMKSDEVYDALFKE